MDFSDDEEEEEEAGDVDLSSCSGCLVGCNCFVERLRKGVFVRRRRRRLWAEQEFMPLAFSCLVPLCKSIDIPTGDISWRGDGNGSFKTCTAAVRSPSCTKRRAFARSFSASLAELDL